MEEEEVQVKVFQQWKNDQKIPQEVKNKIVAMERRGCSYTEVATELILDIKWGHIFYRNYYNPHKSVYREHANLNVRATIVQSLAKSLSHLRLQITAGYDGTRREGHYYQIWLSEVRRQLGREEPKKVGKKQVAVTKGQKELF